MKQHIMTDSHGKQIYLNTVTGKIEDGLGYQVYLDPETREVYLDSEGRVRYPCTCKVCGKKFLETETPMDTCSQECFSKPNKGCCLGIIVVILFAVLYFLTRGGQ